MIDSHCHLWFKHFAGEEVEVIKRAEKAGVSKMICVGCDEESSRRSVELAREYDSVYAAVGLHPTEIKIPSSKGQSPNIDLVWMKVLRELSDKVVAIGETGIDYYHEPYDPELQKAMFREQCLLAQEFDLPVIVHLRNARHPSRNKESGHFSLEQAELDCLHVLEEVDMKPGKVIFHCFSGNRMMAEAVLERGWYISLSGVVTYPKAEELREVVKITPLDKLLVETDCPFLTPQKYRGGRNEPSYVIEVAKRIAELKGLSYQELEKNLEKNTNKVFGLK